MLLYKVDFLLASLVPFWTSISTGITDLEDLHFYYERR